MRLPFDQTNLRSPSQNRLSPVSSPRVQPLDLQTSANTAKLESLKQLGKGIFSIGDAIFQNYANEIRDEKKRNDLLIQYDLNEFSAEQKRDLENNPPDSFGDASARIRDRMYGNSELDGDNPGFAKQLAEKYGFSEKEMEVYLRKYEVENRLDAMVQQTQRENTAKVFNVTTKLDKGLTDYVQNFDINGYEGLSKTELSNAIDTRLLEIWKDSTEGLNTVLKQKLEIETYEDFKKIKQGFLGQYDTKINQENLANLGRKINSILSKNFEREEALSQIRSTLNTAEEEGTITEAQKVEREQNAQALYDRTLYERLIREDPQRLLEMMQSQKEGEDSIFPGMSPLERMQKYNEVQNVINGNLAEGLSNTRKSLEDSIKQTLNPNQDLASLELFVESEAQKLPDETERASYLMTFDYTKRLRGRIPADPNKTNLPYLESQLLEPEPLTVNANGEYDPSAAFKKVQVDNFKKQIKAIMDSRLSDMGRSWQMMNPQADPFAESSIKANLEHQIRFLGNPNQSLNSMVRSGRVRLLPNAVQEQAIVALESLESGVEYARALDTTLKNAGQFAPYLLEQLGRDKKDGGIGLEPSSYFNTVFLQNDQPEAIRNNILGNLRRSVRNRETNNKNFGVLAKGMPKVDFQRMIRTNETIKDFDASYPKNIPGVSAFVNSSIDMVEGYALEMLSRDTELTTNDAVQMAVDHLINANYVFLDPSFSGGTGLKVRIPRSEMRELTQEQMEDALSVYYEEAIASIADPRIRETAEDRQWAWFNNPDDTGFQLYVRTEDLSSWAAVQGDFSQIKYEKLRVIASLPETTEKMSTGTQVQEFLEDTGLRKSEEQIKKDRAALGEAPKMGTGITLWDILGSGFELIQEGGEWIMESVEPKREYIKKREKQKPEEPKTRSAKKVVEPEENPLQEELTQLLNEARGMTESAGIEKLNEYASIANERIRLNDQKGAQRYIRLVRAQLAEEKTKVQAMEDLLNFRKSR